MLHGVLGGVSRYAICYWLHNSMLLSQLKNRLIAAIMLYECWSFCLLYAFTLTWFEEISILHLTSPKLNEIMKSLFYPHLNLPASIYKWSFWHKWPIFRVYTFQGVTVSIRINHGLFLPHYLTKFTCWIHWLVRMQLAGPVFHTPQPLLRMQVHFLDLFRTLFCTDLDANNPLLHVQPSYPSLNFFLSHH